MSNDKEHSSPNSNQENSPPIFKLPSELLDYCWGYLRARDLLLVSRVCRMFWYTSRCRIFQSLTTNISSPKLISKHHLPRRSMNSPEMLELADARLASFYSDPSAGDLWNMVQCWSVKATPVHRRSTIFPHRFHEHEQNMALRSADAIFQFFSISCNLRTLELIRLDLGREQWVTLGSFPALETLRLISCFFLPSSHLECPLKLKELAIAGDSFGPRSIDKHAVSVLFNPAHLEKLTLIDFLVTHTVLVILSSMEQFPHITYLSIIVESLSHRYFFNFLAAIPSLTTLRIFPWSVNIAPNRPLPALSSLRSYDGYPHLLSHIVPGRPVDCVCLVLLVVTSSKDVPDDFDIHSDLESTVLDISRSAVPVRKLAIEYFIPTLEHFTAIANYLPDLHRLDLGIISGPPSFTSDSEDDIIPSVPSFDIDLDCARNSLDTYLDTMQGLLRWLAAGSAPLPPKLESFRLSYSSAGGGDVTTGWEQREIICCLHNRYPSLREVEVGECRWWREGADWMLEFLDFEEA